MASFPNAVKSFTTKNTNDIIQASHINDLQDEVTAIETALLNGTGHLSLGNSTLATLSVTGGSTFAGAVQLNAAVTVSSAALVTIGGGLMLPNTEGSTGPLGGSTAWDDLSLGAQTSLFQLNPSQNVTLSGLLGGVHGRTVLIQNVTSQSTVTILHNQISLASNRFACSTATAVSVPVGPNKSLWVHYSTTFGTFWRPASL